MLLCFSRVLAWEAVQHYSEGLADTSPSSLQASPLEKASLFTVFRIRIQSGQWIRIRIRNPDPDPEGQDFYVLKCWMFSFGG
jgi:hypothetical protein